MKDGFHAEKAKVLIAAPVHPVLTDGLAALGYDCVIREKITQAIACELIRDCTGVITSTRLMLDRGLIDAAPTLRWIGRMGSGMEVIDTEYAALRGVTCMPSPEGNCNAVAEHALGMLLSLIRRIVWAQNEMTGGLWRREENRGTELEGKTIAIIGYGHTGAAFAKKLQGFDTCILAYDKYRPEGIPPHMERCDDLLPVFEKADIVSFHVPLQEDTHHYFDRQFIENMRKPFILINTSRGTVVHLAALHDGLTTGKVRGACLDVFEEEPVVAASGQGAMIKELLQQPNIVVTPHIAGYTVEALYKMSAVLLHKLQRWHGIAG